MTKSFMAPKTASVMNTFNIYNKASIIFHPINKRVKLFYYFIFTLFNRNIKNDYHVKTFINLLILFNFVLDNQILN